MKDRFDSELKAWTANEDTAIEILNKSNTLWIENSIKLKLFRKPLRNLSPSELINQHIYAKDVVKKSINLNDTLEMINEIRNIGFKNVSLDLGRLSFEWIQQQADFSSKNEFVQTKLKDCLDTSEKEIKPKDVVLYGFGRIGRLCAREILEQDDRGRQFRLRAIVCRKNGKEEISKRAELFRKDSVHGEFHGTVVENFENNELIINGHSVLMIEASDPTSIDYASFGIEDAIVIDNTGVWRDREALSQHLSTNGVSKAILTAPGNGIPNIVYGVNHANIDFERENIFSAASCTTNAIVPIINVMQNTFGIEKGHIETVHSYTNDQNLLDNFHKKYRRGRAAASNMVITETGAAKAVAKVLPAIAGKLTGNAVRVPTINGSLAIISLTLEKAVTKESVNEAIREAALNGPLVEQIEYSCSNELVSTDIIGKTATSIFDSPATIVSADGKSVVLYTWYDNEYSYTRQVIRLLKSVAGVKYNSYY